VPVPDVHTVEQFRLKPGFRGGARRLLRQGDGFELGGGGGLVEGIVGGSVGEGCVGGGEGPGDAGEKGDASGSGGNAGEGGQEDEGPGGVGFGMRCAGGDEEDEEMLDRGGYGFLVPGSHEEELAWARMAGRKRRRREPEDEVHHATSNLETPLRTTKHTPSHQHTPQPSLRPPRPCPTITPSTSKPKSSRPPQPPLFNPPPTFTFHTPLATTNTTIASTTTTNTATPHRPRFLLQTPHRTSAAAIPALLPNAFSPHRRKERFLPGGWAAQMRGWIVDASASASASAATGAGGSANSSVSMAHSEDVDRGAVLKIRESKGSGGLVFVRAVVVHGRGDGGGCLEGFY